MLLFINETGSGDHVRFEANHMVLKNGDNELPIRMRSALIDLTKQTAYSAESSVTAYPELGIVVENKEARVERISQQTRDVIVCITRNAARYEPIATDKNGGGYSIESVIDSAGGKAYSLIISAKRGNFSIKVSLNGKEKAFWTSIPGDADSIKNFEEAYQGLELHSFVYCPSIRE